VFIENKIVHPVIFWLWFVMHLIIIISGFGIYGAAVVPDSGLGNTWQRLTLVLHEFLSNGYTIQVAYSHIISDTCGLIVKHAPLFLICNWHTISLMMMMRMIKCTWKREDGRIFGTEGWIVIYKCQGYAWLPPTQRYQRSKSGIVFFSVCGCVSMWWLKPFEILSSDFYGSKMWSKARTCSKMAVFRCTVMRGYDLQGDHLSGNVREFDSSCQGSVRAFTMSQENFREKILSGKSCLKLFIVGLSCILASIQVFSRSLCCVKYYIYGWIMHRFIPTPTTDSDTSTGMIWVLSATNRQGISHCLEWRVVSLAVTSLLF